MNVERIIAQMVRPRNEPAVSAAARIRWARWSSRRATSPATTPRSRSARRSTTSRSSLREGEILGIAGLVGAGRTELVIGHLSAPTRASRRRSLARGPQDRYVRTPLKAIRAGLALVPEDRKHHGIVRDLSVGAEHHAVGAGRAFRTPRASTTTRNLAAVRERDRPAGAEDRQPRRCPSRRSRAATSKRPCWPRCC